MAWDGRWSGAPADANHLISPRLCRQRIDEFVERMETCKTERAERIAAAGPLDAPDAQEEVRRTAAARSLTARPRPQAPRRVHHAA